MKRAIVVGVNGSASMLEVVRWAARYAAMNRSVLRLVSGVFPGPETGLGGSYPVPSEVYAQLDARAHEWLAAAAREVSTVPGCFEIDQEVKYGHPAWMLVSESARASRVVVGPPEVGESTGHGFGSTAEALVAHSECPVVVVRRPVLAEEGDDRPVIVGVDGSRIGEAAVEVAFEEASLRGVPLVAVHTWSDVAGSDWFEWEIGLDWEAVATSERAVLAERLAGWQEKYPDVPVRCIVERDRPVRYLVEHGAQAQLMVVGSRGRGGFTGMLLGSTSRALVHSAPCPLLVARPPG